MKKSTILIIFLLLAMLKNQAQDYLIGFAGTGDTTVVSTVTVTNLTSGATVTLNGGDILHLFGSVGIGTPDIEYGKVQIYPNPTAVKSTLTFFSPESGNTVISIVDLSGSIVCQISALLSPGSHAFRVSGLRTGMYFVKVTGKNYFYSTKLISQNNQQGEAGIEYVSTVMNIPGNELKNSAATIEMPYNEGDQLLFKCLSGRYSTVVPDVPTSSKTIMFNFAACTDYDNNNYSIVQIGTQIWMAENLKVGVRIDSIQEQTNNGTIEKYCYNDDLNNCNTYGGLYQWNEMMQYVTTPGVQGICPPGWHIPTDGEWCTVTQFLDPTVNCGDYENSGINAGGKMKSSGTLEAGTGLWSSPNTGATNESGFTAVPAGYRNFFGAFNLVGKRGFWWSSSEGFTGNICRGLGYEFSNVSRIDYYWYLGFSVRCIRDF